VLPRVESPGHREAGAAEEAFSIREKIGQVSLHPEPAGSSNQLTRHVEGPQQGDDDREVPATRHAELMTGASVDNATHTLALPGFFGHRTSGFRYSSPPRPFVNSQENTFFNPHGGRKSAKLAKVICVESGWLEKRRDQKCLSGIRL
jgi:hypothetical protein